MGKFRPTDAQREAIASIDRSVCVRAGAGTGKTTVLVGRYMQLLRERRAMVGEIAALTYTDKAAKVMKDRIRTRCAAMERDAADVEDAAWWRRQRVDLETASISTIHSFCARILGEHPVEAGIDPQFTVLDRVEGAILLERCIDDVLKRLLEEADRGVLTLCRSFALGRVRGMLTSMMSKRAEVADALARIESKSDDEVLDAWRAMLQGAQAAHVDRVLVEMSRSGAAATLRLAQCSDPGDKLEAMRCDVAAAMDALAHASDPERKVTLGASLRATIGHLGVGSRKAWGEETIAAVKDAMRTLKDLLDAVPGGAFGRDIEDLDREALAHTRTLGRVYREVLSAYGVRRDAEGCLDFDELLLGARRLLAEHADVRARVQRRIRYLLVDELQDSALIERDIILMIVRDEKVFKRSGEVRIVPGRLFAVGDDKQSIYRFRGAEVSVFRELTRRVDARDVIDLDMSFRTVPRGVAFANDLFGSLLGREEKAALYESRYFDLKASRTEDSDFLEVMIPEPVDDETAGEARSREARMIATRIREMVEGREKLAWDETSKQWRAVQFGDVAVLFRAMTQSHVYESAFREADLPYYIVSGGGFYQMQEVIDLLTALKTLERPRDEVALAGTLRSPLFGISDETLYFMRHTGSIREGLARAEEVRSITDDQRAGLIDARAILGELSRTRSRVSIARLLETLLERTAFDATLLAQFMGRQKLANVEKLVDLARSFESKGLFTLDEFIRYIEKFVEEEQTEGERAAEEESSNVVRLMSVHQAKGMEFPVVFAADLSHQTGGRHAPVLFDREIGISVDLRSDDNEPAVLSGLIRDEDRRRDEAESMRVLYVALTRARDRLVLSGWLSKGKVPPRSWLGMLVDRYALVDEAGGIADEITFGEKEHNVPVRTEVPTVSESEAKAHTHAAWKVVKRLERLTGRLEDAGRASSSEFTRRIEAIPVTYAAKRRFVPSEFTVYRDCPKRYKLEKIDGVLSSDAAAGGRRGGNGALFGTLTHRVLAAWDFNPTTLGPVISQVLGAEELPQEVDAQALASEIERMVSDAQDAGLLREIAESTERLSEYPLAARVADFVIDGIIDSVHRLVDGTFEIVDYKTDRLGNRSITEVARHYEMQQAAYAVALSTTGVTVSRVSLVFLRARERHAWSCDEVQLEKWEASLVETVTRIRAGEFDAMHEGACHCGLGWVCGRDAEATHDLDLS